MRASEAANVKKRWREQHDDVLFPDEVGLCLCFKLSHAKLLLVILCHLLTQTPPPVTLSWAEDYWVEQPHRSLNQCQAMVMIG